MGSSCRPSSWWYLAALALLIGGVASVRDVQPAATLPHGGPAAQPEHGTGDSGGGVWGWMAGMLQQLLPRRKLVSSSDNLWADRAEQVKEAFIHSFDGYHRYAWGMDELLPLSRRGKDGLGSYAATILDSLDTLLIMGLKEDPRAHYGQAREWVRDHLTFNEPHKASRSSTFETTIRALGGLLSAYEFSGHDEMYLDKAKLLANRLMKAFTTRSGLAASSVPLHTDAHIGTTQTSFYLAEVGTLQLEFRALAQYTGEAKYEKAAMKFMHLMADRVLEHGAEALSTTQVNERGNNAGGRVTMGGGGDSYYEYLLKLWVQSTYSVQDAPFKRVWEKAMNEADKKLVRRTGGSSPRTYLSPQPMEHLACFLPGNMALGSQWQALGQEGIANNRTALLELAEELTHTCIDFYLTSSSGISPESVTFSSDGTLRGSSNVNIQRPELIESLMYLYRITKKVEYREAGWTIFESFQRFERADVAYTGLTDVRHPDSRRDQMETFWLAETLKYFYLLFSDESVVPLDKYVFNTEAHPFPVFQGSKLFDPYVSNKAFEENEALLGPGTARLSGMRTTGARHEHRQPPNGGFVVHGGRGHAHGHP